MGRMIVFHHNDLDGRCAAAIVYHCGKIHGETDFVFREVNYQDKIKFEDITKEDKVAVVDFSFKPEVMAEVRKKAGHVFWCDHHVSAKDYDYADLPGHRDFNNKGLSGCECTWKYCFQNLSRPMPSAVELIGDYDAWRLQEQPLCFELYEALKLEDTRPQSTLWDRLLGFVPGHDRNQDVMDLCDKGKTVIKYRDNYCAEILKEYGYATEIDGHKAYALNLYRFGSKQFGGMMQRVPVCIAYIHNGREFVVSLYSETVDVSVIAKKFGGGGHKGAAGFVCRNLVF